MEQAMREEFEAWWRSAEVLKSKRAVAFDAWQASRAALVIEMPPRVTAEDVAEHLDIDDEGAVEIAHMVNGSIAACGAFIKQAGIEVK
ncbi:hypothetical protein P3855_01990 [Pseudomonas aeruginosa]|nr:hypothetical protein [Pseudomonas aeruginosa]